MTEIDLKGFIASLLEHKEGTLSLPTGEEITITTDLKTVSLTSSTRQETLDMAETDWELKLMLLIKFWGRVGN